MLNPKMRGFVHRLAFFVVYLGFGLVIAVQSHAAQLLSFEGRATDLNTSALLYIENHQVILNDEGQYLSAYVTYSDPKGDVFAEKTLDYVKNSLTPELMFYDKRSEERTSVLLNNKGDEASFQVLIESGKQRSETRVSLDEPLIVVDAGFDRLIELHWQTLIKNKALDFTFLAITRGQLINFEAIRKKVGEASIFVELHPRNFFINMLVDPILLEYDTQTKRLLSFEGLTNIEQFKDGERTEENYIARIEYSYQPLKPYSIISIDMSDPNLER